MIQNIFGQNYIKYSTIQNTLNHMKHALQLLATNRVIRKFLSTVEIKITHTWTKQLKESTLVLKLAMLRNRVQLDSSS